jgi:hypothetical protein
MSKVREIKIGDVVVSLTDSGFERKKGKLYKVSGINSWSIEYMGDDGNRWSGRKETFELCKGKLAKVLYG